MSKLLNTATDGWAPADDWEKLQIAHKEIHESVVQKTYNTEDFDEDDPLQSEDDLWEIWPFDLETDQLSEEKERETEVL